MNQAISGTYGIGVRVAPAQPCKSVSAFWSPADHGWAHPAPVAAAMAASSVTVVTNANRLKLWQPEVK